MTPEEITAIRLTIQHTNAALRARGVYVGKNTQVWGYVDAIFPKLVTIGDNCIISGNAALLTHGVLEHPDEGLHVFIANNCFIGFGAIILPGVIVHEGAIVGAGAVVTHDVPEHAVVAGNPAKWIHDRDPLEHDEYIARRERGELL